MIAPTDEHYTQDGIMNTWSAEDRAFLTQAIQAMRDIPHHEKWTHPPLKLQRAETAILQGRVSPGHPPGLYHIRGNSGHYTVDSERCTCDGFLNGKTIWCTHRAAAEAYTRYLDLKTGNGQAYLFPPPPTIEERLATPPEDDETINFTTGELAPEEAPVDHPHETDFYSPMAEGDEKPVPVMTVETSPVHAPLDDDSLKRYRQTIMRQLGVLGVKPTNKAEAEDAIMTQVGLVLAPEQFALITERLSEIITARTRATPPPIPDRYIKEIHGKKHVLFVGLLAMAHEKGLEELSAEFISVTDDLALAKGHAFFADGRKFYEAADATPGNVSSEPIKKHFARMALTRAKARCLRDALNIAEASAEEVE